MDYKQIQDLIKLVNKNNIAELKLEQDDFKIVIRSQDGISSDDDHSQPTQVVMMPSAPVAPVAQPVAQATAPPAPQTAAEATAPPAAPKEDNAGLIEIKSPMIGTFYRAAGPDKDPFVSIGTKINIGDTICMVEAMKLFNEIEAEVTGKVVKILVEDATPVEYDQPLFLLDPNA